MEETLQPHAANSGRAQNINCLVVEEPASLPLKGDTDASTFEALLKN